jgi:2-haloacid dehalogenase
MFGKPTLILREDYMQGNNATIDLNNYEVLTFDCYGTMIDWESGVLDAICPALSNHNIQLSNTEIFATFSEIENEVEAGKYIKYWEVLRNVVKKMGDRFNFTPNPTEVDALANSLPNWQPFPDTIEALKILKQKFNLAVISNVDNELFAETAKYLQVEFDYVITAEQVKSYKPSHNNFHIAFDRIGLPKEKILHVAASVYHDIVPAKALSMTAVWVNRRGIKQDSGADLVVPDLKTLANIVSQD